MAGTAYGDGRNLPSNWPAGIRYSPDHDKYIYSVSHTWQISALDHLHVVVFDVPPAPPAGNTMTLTLPVMANLPLQSRIYFFYVSQANPEDILKFVPVTGSGDTINGNAVSYSFLLNGEPQLYIALAVKGNYVVHAFGRNSITTGSIPTEFYEYDSLVAPTANVVTPYSTSNPGSYEMVAGNGASSAAVVIVDGMQGYITPNSLVPAGSFQGFLCNQSGTYLINPDIDATLIYTPAFFTAAGSNLGPYQANLLEYNADGSFSKTIISPARSNSRKSSQLPDEFSAVNYTATATNAAYTTVTEGANIGAIFLDPSLAGAIGNLYPGPATTAFSYAASIPVVAVPGFLVNTTGNYRLTWNMSGTFLYGGAGTSSGAYQGAVRIYNSAGSLLDTKISGAFNPNGYALATPSVKYASNGVTLKGLTAGQYIAFFISIGTPAVGTGIVVGQNTFNAFFQMELLGNTAAPSNSQTMPWHTNVSYFASLTAGKTYVPSVSWDNSTVGQIGPGTWTGGLTFCYWAPTLQTSLFSMMSGPEVFSLAQSIENSNTDPEVYAPMHLRTDKDKVIEIQKKASQMASNAAAMGSSSYVSAQPSFTLSDIEQIVGRALAAERGKSAPPSSSIVTSSSGAKRKRVGEKEAQKAKE